MEYKYDPILCMNIPVEKSKVKTTDGKYSKIFDDYPAYVEMVKERLTNTKYKSDSDFYRAVEKARKEAQGSAQRLENAYNELVADYNRAKNRLNAIYNELHNDKVIEFIRERNVN